MSDTASGPYDALIAQAAAQHNIDPGVLTSLLMHESGMNPGAVSPAGAIGIAQIMPATAKGLGIDPRDPAQAIPAAALYLRQNLNRFGGDYQQALAAYNWGPGNVSRFGMAGAPSSVRSYVANVLGGRSAPGTMVAAAGRPALPVPVAGPSPVSPQVAGEGTQLAGLFGADMGPPTIEQPQPQAQSTGDTAAPAPGRRLIQPYSLADVLAGTRNA